MLSRACHGQCYGNRYVPLGLLRTAFHGRHHHPVFLRRCFTLSAFDSFTHLTFNFRKFLSTNPRTM